MAGKFISDGLGGFYGVSHSLKLGAKLKMNIVFIFYLTLPFIILHAYDPGIFTMSCLSFVLALQRNNESYKQIKYPYHYAESFSYASNSYFFCNVCKLFFGSVVFTLCLRLLILSGDIHPNPGPASVDNLADSLSEVSDSSLAALNSHLSILHLNVQSLLPKLDILSCEAEAYDILVFTESWLKPNISDADIEIVNFHQPFRKDRSNRLGGGVVIYARDSLACRRRYDIEINGLEAVWVELRIKSKQILIGGIYRPPDSNDNYFNLLLESMDRAVNTNIIDIIILGDFNLNILHNANSKVNELMTLYSLSQLITEPTYYTENSSSLIDLVFVRNKSNILFSGVADTFLSDQTRFHCPQIVLLKFFKHHTKSFKRKIWNYKQADYNAYRNILAIHDWQSCEHVEINIHAQNIANVIESACQRSIPSKLITVRANEHPWITAHVKRLIRKRKRTFRKFKKTNNPELFAKYKRLRNDTVNEIRRSKKAYYNKLESLLSTENPSSKIFWKTAKQLMRNVNHSQNTPPLIMDGKIAENDLAKACMLNSYFSSQSVIDDKDKNLPDPLPVHYNTLDTILITEQDVHDVLKNLNINKACGPDLLSPVVLKEGALHLKKPLSVLFNSSLQKGIYPDSWKKANVTAIPKKDDKTLPSNYRPISLLSQLGKSMERCVHKYTYNYINQHNLFTPLQSGFLPGDSTTYQLIHTYHTFCEAVDKGKEVRAVFCDISKAFDRVWHKGLLYKLACFGISGTVLKWFRSYLAGRQQRVVINGQSSDWAPVNAGVPQGSILGPLLFLVFINDIVLDLNSSIRLFADDTSLYIVVDTPQSAALSLNSDLSIISEWATKWLVQFNASKTKTMIVSRKLHPPIHPPLFFKNAPLEETISHKHLGLILSNNCSWKEHIVYTIERAKVRLNLLRALKYKLKREALEKIYISFVRPLLEYSSSVWDNCSGDDKKQLDSIHHEAARIVSGATKLCSIDKLLSDLGWESLQERRSKQKLVIFYKMIHNITPNYLSNLIPPLVQENNTYNLRNSDDLRIIHSNTNLFYNSFLPSTIREWNRLPVDIKTSPSLSIFKLRLNQRFKKAPKYFYAGSRLGQILHARLRLDCSSLNGHLYSKNIIDNPLCPCGQFESPYHFFFKCHRYSNVRRTYLSDILPNFDVSELLFGKQTLSNAENETLFEKVQNFIIHSKRFVRT